jgi:hypothetical protein
MGNFCYSSNINPLSLQYSGIQVGPSSIKLFRLNKQTVVCVNFIRNRDEQIFYSSVSVEHFPQADILKVNFR